MFKKAVITYRLYSELKFNFKYSDILTHYSTIGLVHLNFEVILIIPFHSYYEIKLIINYSHKSPPYYLKDEKLILLMRNIIKS